MNKEEKKQVELVYDPSIAEEYREEQAERAMRHAIESGFDRCGYNDEVLSMFGNTIDPSTGKPTNSEFVARMARLCREGLSHAD